MITKNETCSECNGSGVIYYEEEFSGCWGCGSELAYTSGCSRCGGSGTDKFDLRKGSGKVKVTYKEIICTECNGDKNVRYMKSGYGPQHTLFGSPSYEEQKAWEKEFTEIKTCQECKGSGKELRYVSSEPIKDGCFITTAYVSYLNKKDNCYELEILRNFRDNYIQNIPNGNFYIEEYYEKSPRIVEYIELQANKDDIYQYIHESIVKAISHIENKQYKDAFNNYKNMYIRLLEISR